MIGPLDVDSLDIWGATVGLPEQVAAAMASVEAGTWDPGVVSNIVVCGMGGSGIAGDILATVASREMAVPVALTKSASIPAFVGTDTLVFAISFSGETEETLASFEAASDAGASVVAISSGGKLAKHAAERGALHVALPKEIPQPRAGIGAMAIPPLLLCERAGLLEGVTSRLRGVVTTLERRRETETGSTAPAAEVARRIGRSFPLVYGSVGPSATAAARWKTQINENAKVPAFAGVVPELCHNEIAGFGQGGDITRQLFSLVMLRHDGEDSDIMRRFSLIEEILDEVVVDVIEVRSTETDALACCFDLMYAGDFVSLHMAAREGTDPGPVPVLAEIKSRLSPHLST